MFRNSFMIITTHFIAAISSIITIVLLPEQLSSKSFSLFFLFFFASSIISWFYIYSYYLLQKNKVKKIINTIGLNGKIWVKCEELSNTLACYRTIMECCQKKDTAAFKDIAKRQFKEILTVKEE